MRITLKATLATSLLILPVLAFASEKPIVQKYQYSSVELDKLSLSFEHSKINIKHIQGDKINVVHSQILKKGDADKCLYEIKNSIDSDSLTLENKRKGRLASFWKSYGDCSVDQTLDIEIGETVLDKFSINVRHSQLVLDNQNASNTKFNAQHSNININEVISTNFDMELAHSYFSSEKIIAEQAEIEGAHSSFHIDNFESDVLSSDWSHGKINIKKSKVENLKTINSHSPITLSNHQGENLNATLSHSKLYANTTITGGASIEGAHSNIKLIGAVQKLAVKNAHGYVELTQLTAKDFNVLVNNEHGNIIISVPEGSTYNYYLDNDHKEIERENSSDNYIRIHTEHGSVKIKEH